MSLDPWSAFLDWLATVLVPAWGELISLLPYVLIGTIAGPIVTLIILMWAWYWLGRKRGRVRRGRPQPVAASRDAQGRAVVPPNVPYCEQHALVYPARSRTCSLNGDPLSVTCPVDGNVRNAEIDTCAACGTTFKLGAGAPSSVVLTGDGPPEGGAALA